MDRGRVVAHLLVLAKADAVTGCEAYTADDWWAIVGPSPRPIAAAVDQTPHDKTRRLAVPESLGDVRLVPGGQLFVEYDRSEPLALDGIMEHESWPILVEGTTPALVHLEHDVATATRVVRAAVLLSVAWKEPWVVRSAPFRSQAKPPKVPESWRPPPGEIFDPPLALRLIEDDPDAYPAKRLPSWMGDAWSLVEQDARIWNAALAWHEGLVLQSRHPSFAVVAYVSAVEALSHSKLACDRLDIAIKKRTTSRARVETMLGIVMSGEQASSVVDSIWKSRNTTSHDASLFGFEASLGAVSPLTIKFHDIDGVITPILHGDPGDDVYEFLSGVVRPLAMAVHALTFRVLAPGATFNGS